MDVSRRNFLVGSGAISLPLLVAGCGFVPQQSVPGTAGMKTLTFTTWGADAELAGLHVPSQRLKKQTWAPQSS
jgi:multiple sugar transport system substrate-binding protein